MNNNQDTIIYEQIHNSCVSDIKNIGITSFQLQCFQNTDFEEYINEDFAIYNKILRLGKNIEYDFKVYFYKGEFVHTGIGLNSRLFTVFKKYFEWKDHDAPYDFELYRDIDCNKYYAIKINGYTVIKASLLGKGSRKRFFINTIESDISYLKSGKFENIASNFIQPQFNKIEVPSSSSEKILMNFLNKGRQK